MTFLMRQRPLISAGVFLGIGMGGFFDGILFHQILQVHNMLSSKIPPLDLISVKVNMVWDGFFHAAVWILTALGLFLLFAAGRRRDVTWSGKILLGSMFFGWGLFNFVEGIIDHEILGLHHVVENALNKLPYDLAFLGSGIIFMLIGWIAVQSAKDQSMPSQSKITRQSA